MKVSFDYNDLIGTYVMICRDIATMYDIPLKEDELAECFLIGFCQKMRKVLMAMDVKQEKFASKTHPYNIEKKQMKTLPQHRMQLDYMLTRLEEICEH